MKRSETATDTKIKSIRLPDAELDVMLVLWNSETPLKASAILDRLEGKRDWSMSTLHVLLARMSQRGVIASENDKNYKLYVPSITKEYYRQHETKNFIQKLYDNSAKRLIVSLIETNGITDDEIDEISRLLNEKKKG